MSSGGSPLSMISLTAFFLTLPVPRSLNFGQIHLPALLSHLPPCRLPLCIDFAWSHRQRSPRPSSTYFFFSAASLLTFLTVSRAILYSSAVTNLTHSQIPHGPTVLWLELTCSHRPHFSRPADRKSTRLNSSHSQI